MADSRQFALVDLQALPEAFVKVLNAKLLLAKGEAKSSADACRMAGVSRGAYYKYKDSVFWQDAGEGARTQTLYLRLTDQPGVLSAVLSELYHNKANILTVNQNIPVDLVATVTISFRASQSPADHTLPGRLLAIGGVLEAKLI